MAASIPYPRSHPLPQGAFECLSASALDKRLDEEISRAERCGTQLSCLLVVIDNLDEMAREHGGELREQTLDYVAGALRPELRRFDRIGRPHGRDLLIVLPGADGPRGEMVARRVLDRLRTIKIEASGARRALLVSVGLAAWADGSNREDLVGRARAASRRSNGGDVPAASSALTTHALESDEPLPSCASDGLSPALGRPAQS